MCVQAHINIFSETLNIHIYASLFARVLDPSEYVLKKSHIFNKKSNKVKIKNKEADSSSQQLLNTKSKA